MRARPTPPRLSRRHLIVLAAAAATAGGVTARQVTMPGEVAAELPGALSQGGGRLRWFGFSVYDARLWVTPGFDTADFDESPFALEIVYTRAIEGRKIAERSLDEMDRVASLSATQRERWLAAMLKAFPDVKEGDRLTGVFRPNGPVRFYFNGELRGEVRDAEFAQRFFGIWLGPETSEPALRRALLGETRKAS